MSPALFEADLLEQRRLRQWQRLASPDAPVAPEPSPAAEPHALGYPRHHLLARALLPLALAILIFLLHSESRSDASPPRGSTSLELRQ